MMKAWITYIKQRFPIPVYVLMSSGLALSGGTLLGEPLTDEVWWTIVLTFFYAMWLFATLRLMDELKDYDKDLIAHPERPLPKGVLTLDQVRHAIGSMMTLGILLSFSFGFVSTLALSLAVLTTLWLWLMYREFYIGEVLQKRPLFYAITHQIILIPFCLLMTWDASDLSVGWAIAVLGSFFSYEVSRKLDPNAHPILGTYLSVYGKAGSMAIVFVLTGLAAFGAWKCDASLWMTPFAGLTLLSYAILWIRPMAFKVVEGIATVSLFFHIWSPALKRLFL